MELYIVRHAIAVTRGTKSYPNDDRPLTKVGIRRMVRAARGIARIIDKPDIILTSPLIRADYTARIAAAALGCKKQIVRSDSLLPERSPADVLEAIRKLGNSNSRVMVVGHEPLLSALAGKLLGSSRQMIEVRKGGLCRIDYHNPNQSDARLIYHLKPNHLRMLADA